MVNPFKHRKAAREARENALRKLAEKNGDLSADTKRIIREHAETVCEPEKKEVKNAS